VSSGIVNHYPTKQSVLVLILGMLVSITYVTACRGPGPNITLIPAIPNETEPMLTAEPITARFLLWNKDTKTFDISKRTTIPAGMTVHFVPIDDIIGSLEKSPERRIGKQGSSDFDKRYIFVGAFIASLFVLYLLVRGIRKRKGS